MSQLTRQDVAEVVEEVLDRVLDQKLEEKLEVKLEEKLDKKLDEKLDEKLDQRFDNFEERMDRKFGVFMEHMDDKFDSLSEAVSTMNTTIGTLAKQSDLEELRQDVTTIKIAVKATNKDLHQLTDRFNDVVDHDDGPAWQL